ncbi:MAG TPA: tol-pal system protein YbgF [Xanthomonadaceae bacterium]|nr:tol-pal system protein YbgF [Xanthomonadaceae bacterium]
MSMRLRCVAIGCAAATMLVAVDASAQSRASLADRVAALEARVQQNQSDQSVEQLNRIAQLESDVKALRALVEQMQNENEQGMERSKAQYIDLDSRLARLENAPAAAPTAVSRPAPTHAPARPAAPPAVPVAPAAAAPASSANPANEQAAYAAALAAVRADQYADSAQRFSAFVQQYPDSPLAVNAYYWMGESYYVTQNYQLALEAFKTVVTRYPDSPKAPGALLKLGYSQDGLKQRDAAEATLRDVIQKYPTSDEAGQAQSRLRAMSMDSGG